MNVILLGPPACGKGTQCQLILKQLAMECLGTGQLLRDEVSSGSELGKEIDSFINHGAYVPDALIMRMVFKWLNGVGEKPWLLDGFPRTLVQAEALNAEGFRPDVVIGIEVSQDVLEERILSRLICSSCSATHSRKVVGDGPCPDCGGVLVVRDDDGIESFRKRYANFNELTKPLYAYYEAQGSLVRVDGTLPPEQVFERVASSLKLPGA
ncbi:adenylate kinase family protein [Rubritalea marina]|uniref:adenylate kinase family protein n=1 Tax=Rubritalea marina TaxID=361055 RepID=UPI00039A7592|nr:nucleoside monophosphate kinase [Rubritalea marina]